MRHNPNEWISDDGKWISDDGVDTVIRGKYKNDYISVHDLACEDPEYVEWICENTDIDDEERDIFIAALEYRNRRR